MSGYVIVMGSLNLDLVVRTPHLPAVGESVIGGPFATFPGGKGANQALAAARLGADVRLIGRVGRDTQGDSLLRSLQASGVDISRVSRDDQSATGVALITVDPDGRNTLVVALGANDMVSPEDISRHAGLFNEASLLILQLECPMDAVKSAVEHAKANHVPVVLNPAPARPLEPEMLELVDYLIPNETELYLLSGCKSIPDAIARLQEQGVKTLIVTLGEQGVLLVDRGVQISIPAFAVKAVDTTAAGDAFIGAFSVALIEGRPLMEAVKWGSAAGAIAVTRLGAQPSLPDRTELLQFLEDHAKH